MTSRIGVVGQNTRAVNLQKRRHAAGVSICVSRRCTTLAVGGSCARQNRDGCTEIACSLAISAIAEAVMVHTGSGCISECPVGVQRKTLSPGGRHCDLGTKNVDVI